MAKNKNKQDTWVFSELVDSLRRSVDFSYKLERTNEGKDIPWDGPILTTNILIAGADNIRERLAEQDPEELKFANKQADAMDRVLTCAIQLGIEQGFRMLLSERYMRRMDIRGVKRLIDMLETDGNPDPDELHDAVDRARSSIRRLEEHIEDPGTMQ